MRGDGAEGGEWDRTRPGMGSDTSGNGIRHVRELGRTGKVVDANRGGIEADGGCRAELVVFGLIEGVVADEGGKERLCYIKDKIAP